MLGNKGIAAALNVAKNRAINENYKWLLTMDQDSRFNESDIEKFKNYIKERNEEKVAIYSPFHSYNGLLPTTSSLIEEKKL